MTAATACVLADKTDELPLVSIIMPVYDTPLKHVQRAIRSVLCQTYTNIELIVVIDGCEEAYHSQLNALCACDHRSKVLHIEHSGVSAARNHGIEHAAGEYIMFMDSDDELIDVCVEHAVLLSKEYNLDIVCGAIDYVYVGSTKSSQLSFGDDSHMVIIEGEEMNDLAEYFFSYETINDLAQIRTVPRGPVAKLYARHNMDIRFDDEIKLYEDGVFNALAVSKARRVGLVGEIWYQYHMNSFSASKGQGLDERFESHASALERVALEEGFAMACYRAQIRRYFMDSIERESDRNAKGRYGRIVEYLSKPFIVEAFFSIDSSRFDLSAKRRFNYWLCGRKHALLLYLLFSMRAVSKRARGELSRSW